MSATPQDVLREAARILMRDGWTQKTTRNADGQRCVAGALRDAMGLQTPQSVRYEAERTLALFVGTAITTWNDAPERTAEDVILALKRAAEEAS